MSQNILKQAQNIHFIGIGGIGISAIARMLKLEGKNVTGQDLNDSKPVQELIKAGIEIKIGQSLDNIPRDTELIIYTVALENYDPELLQKLKLQAVPILSYPQTLNFISKEKYTIAVSGTHGKTTTTAMIAKIMIDNGLDPTVIVGSLIGNTNFIAGQGKYLIVEADEYKKSFHNLEPSIMVITNIDEDHLDFYKDLEDIQNSFLFLAQKLPEDGFLICNTKLSNLQPIINGVKCQVIDYSEINLTEKLLVPGEHNRQDAKAAVAVGQALGVELEKSNKAVALFTGTWRRFEFKGKTKSGALVYDDYAHNPQKVKAALQGARELYPTQKIIVVFQPHLFSRTKLLLNEFMASFNDADEVILTPIFPAREAFDPTISSEILADSIRKHAQESSLHLTKTNRSESFLVHDFSDFDSIVKYLKANSKKDDVVITMGAGEQYKIGDDLLS